MVYAFDLLDEDGDFGRYRNAKASLAKFLAPTASGIEFSELALAYRRCGNSGPRRAKRL